MSPTPDQIAAAAIQAGCATVLARWTPAMDAAGDDVAALRRVFHGVVVDVGAHLAELLVTAGAGTCPPELIGEAAERAAVIVAEVVGRMGREIGRQAGASFAPDAWLDDVAGQAAAALRQRVAELRSICGGRA